MPTNVSRSLKPPVERMVSSLTVFARASKSSTEGAVHSLEAAESSASLSPYKVGEPDPVTFFLAQSAEEQPASNSTLNKASQHKQCGVHRKTARGSATHKPRPYIRI